MIEIIGQKYYGPYYIGRP